MKRIREYLRWKFGLTPEARSRRAIRNLKLGQGDIALDCGANIGDMTAVLAEKGSEVHAFEPNPHAYQILSQRFAKFPHIHCHHAAVGISKGRMPLYLHELSPHDEVLYSNGSSLLAEKPNVSRDRFIDVEVIDLAEFIESLGCEVAVVKMDIEGSEVDVLNALLARGSLDRVRELFVETHEEKIPELAPRTMELRRILSAHPTCKVSFDWV